MIKAARLLILVLVVATFLGGVKIARASCGYSVCVGGECRDRMCFDNFEHPTCKCWSSCNSGADCGGSCKPNCPAGYCGPNGCGGTCNGSSDPQIPILSLPENNTVDSIVVPAISKSVLFQWLPVTDWGVECTGTLRKYNLCIGTLLNNPCAGTKIAISDSDFPLLPPSSGSNNISGGLWYWAVQAVNKSGRTVTSSSRKLCIEGFKEPSGVETKNTYLSAWSSCNTTTHKRTRTCKEDCGTDNCTAMANEPGGLVEDCLGEVRGTMFDASNMTKCPATDPLTGYAIVSNALPKAANMTFGFADTVKSGNLHPWSPLTSPITTDANGNYNVQVYAPSSYKYDFTNFVTQYDAELKPKLICTESTTMNRTSLTLQFLGSSTSCMTQPCTLQNVSFGFQRDYGGWWQVFGASVHGEQGVRTIIPNIPGTTEAMIMTDSSTGRAGVLTSTDLTNKDTMLGLNPDAKVSTLGWKAESSYQGLTYDWAYFNIHFKKFTTTAWNGTLPTPFVYEPGTNDYQIFVTEGDVTDFALTVEANQKVIFLVKGNVKVTGQVVVPVGSYLAVIAGGDVSFDPGVLNQDGSYNSGVTSADGWYVAKNILVPCADVDVNGVCDKTDVQFFGNGSFVGWESLGLSRDRGEALNLLAPSEKFTYRQDLYDNAPEPMKDVTKLYKPFVP